MDSYIWGGWDPQTFSGEFVKYFEKLKEHYDADLDNIKLARFEDEEGRQCIEKTFYEDIEAPSGWRYIYHRGLGVV